jgi:hypothetical protein
MDLIYGEYANRTQTMAPAPSLVTSGMLWLV